MSIKAFMVALSICQANLDVAYINVKQIVTAEDPYKDTRCSMDPAAYCKVSLTDGQKFLVFMTCKDFVKKANQ